MNVVGEYLGVAKGHPVKVKGQRGDFEFHAAYLNDDGDVSSVCVIGGTSSHRMFRHFTPDRIIIKKARKQ